MQLDVARPAPTRPARARSSPTARSGRCGSSPSSTQLIVDVVRATSPARRAPTRTSITHHTDAFYVLEGEVEFSLGPEPTNVTGPARERSPRAADRRAHLPERERRDRDLPQLPRPLTGFADYIRGAQPVLRPARAAGRRRPSTRRRQRPVEASARHDTSRRGSSDLPQLARARPDVRRGVRGRRPPRPRRHVDSFYVLEGELSSTSPTSLAPGPARSSQPRRGTVARFRNPGPDPLRCSTFTRRAAASSVAFAAAEPITPRWVNQRPLLVAEHDRVLAARRARRRSSAG